MGTIFSGALTALGAGLKLALEVFTRRNEPDMVANAHRAQLQKIQDQATRDVADGDAEKIEDDLAGQ